VVAVSMTVTTTRDRGRVVRTGGVRKVEEHNVRHGEVPGMSAWRYAGPELDDGEKPAVVYFALTAGQSLGLDPFNGLTREVVGDRIGGEGDSAGVRVFSMTLPFHGSMEQNEIAFRNWVMSYENGSDLVSEYCDRALLGIQELIRRGWIDPKRLGIAGLSRGALIASLIAAREQNVKAVLGFAPVTSLLALREFQQVENREGRDQLARLDLLHHSRDLASRSVRFYMGNRDARVGTRNAFNFIEQLAEDGFSQGHRSPRAELLMYPSVGMDGHGTPPKVFRDGARWLLGQIL